MATAIQMLQDLVLGFGSLESTAYSASTTCPAFSDSFTVYSGPGIESRSDPVVGRARDCPLFSSFQVESTAAFGDPRGGARAGCLMRVDQGSSPSDSKITARTILLILNPLVWSNLFAPVSSDHCGSSPKCIGIRKGFLVFSSCQVWPHTISGVARDGRFQQPSVRLTELAALAPHGAP